MAKPEAAEDGAAPIRAGWVIARQHRMAYDPDLVCGAACLDAELDHGTRQWEATVRRAPLDGPARASRRHFYVGASVGIVVDSVRLNLHRTSGGPVHLVEVPYQDARSLVDSGCREVPPAWDGSRAPVNTRVEYLYRDAGNFKTWNSVVVAGALPEGDLASLLDACEPGPDSRLFIPAQVGLPEDRGGFATDADMDTAYFEIDRSSFALTVAPPSVTLTARELAARFETQRGGWDPVAAWGRLMGPDARDEPQDRE